MTSGSSVGEALFASALKGGQALVAPEPQILSGAEAVLVALAEPLGLGCDAGGILDRWIFGRDLQVADVWVCGTHVVRDGTHIWRASIATAY